MDRSQQRRWERDIWPCWKNFITFKTIKRNFGFNTWLHEGRRTKEEKLVIINQMLRDLGEDPNA